MTVTKSTDTPALYLDDTNIDDSLLILVESIILSVTANLGQPYNADNEHNIALLNTKTPPGVNTINLTPMEDDNNPILCQTIDTP